VSIVVRRLGNADDVAFSTGLGGVDATTYGTIAILFRPAADPVFRWLVKLYDSTGADLGGVGVLGNGTIFWKGASTWATEGPVVTFGDWHLLVARKNTGDVRPRFSLQNLATGIWAHADAVDTQLDWVAPTGGSIRTKDATSGEGPDSDYAAAAVWANELPWAADTFGDAEIEAANLDEHLDNWRDADPASGWEFSQPSASSMVEDFTLNRADETSVGVGTPTTVTDLDFIYATGGILALSRNYLRSTQDEPGAGGIIRDLSETPGTPTTVGSGAISSGGFTKVLEFWRVVGATVDASVAIDTSISMSAVSASTLQYQWIVHRYNSADVLQESSTASSAHNTVGVKTQTMALAGPFVAGDKLALSLWLRKAGGGGSRTFTLDINNANSWVEFSVAEVLPDEVVPADALHSHAADQPALTQVHELVPADASHSHTADQPALSQVVDLVPADADHGHTAEQATVTEVEPFPVREFASGEFLTWAIGTGGLDQLLFGAFTIAAIVKRVGAPADQGALLDFAAGLAGSRGFFRYTDTDTMDYLRGQFQSPGEGPAWSAADGWVLVAFTKAAGTTTVRYHKGVLSTGADSWTHQNSAGNVDNDNVTCDRVQTRFAETGGWVFRGRYGVMGAWDSILSDATLEGLTSDYADWEASANVALWRFDQATTSEAVDDQTGNGADQTALSGSTVVTDDPIPGFTFGEAVATITPANASHGHTADAPTLTQTHALVGDDSSHAQTADAATVSVVHQLAAEDATHGHAADQPGLTQVDGLAADDAGHAHVADSPSLTQVHELVAQPADHAHTADQPALTQVHELTPEDAAHGHAADQTTVVGPGDISTNSADHAHTADQPGLTQVHELVVADAAHSHTADQPALAAFVGISAASAAHSHTADQPAIAQAHQLAAADASHAHTAGLVLIDLPGVVVIDWPPVAAHRTSTAAVTARRTSATTVTGG
jgi:hypothetical protein